MDRIRRPRPSLRQFLISYAPDWIVTCVLWILVRYLSNHVTGFRRHFSLTDLSLRYPFAAHQRVSTHALWLTGAIAPLIAQVVINLSVMRSWWDLHHSMLGLWLSITVTSSITQIVKVTVGRPRPDVIARCQPMPGSEDPLWGLSTSAICTQTSKYVLEDGWRSFPSGHSSLSFAGLGFLTFYLVGKLRVFDKRGHTSKVWLSLVPISVAALVAISRTMDYRHHVEDVFAGAILGLVVAYFSYRQYYPHLASKSSHIPYATRFEDEVEYDIDNGTAVFRDADGDDNEEDVALIGGSRKPHADGRR